MQENTKKIDSINERILSILDYYGITRYKLSKITGVSEPILMNIAKGNNRPSVDVVVKILNHYTAINARWLLMGEGEMFSVDKSDLMLVQEPPNQYKQESSCKTDFYKELLREKDNLICSLNREIGKMEATIEQLKKCNPASDYLAYQQKLTRDRGNE